MAPSSTDEQFHFLISCIKHSNQGKPNFDEVAQECNIVSRGAAAKRYERLLKSHENGPPSGATPSPSKTGKATDDGESASPTKASGTKRKTAALKSGAKAASAKRSRKKAAAVASAERIVGSDDKSEGEDGASQDEDANGTGDSGAKQEVEGEDAHANFGTGDSGVKQEDWAQDEYVNSGAGDSAVKQEVEAEE